MAGTDPAAAGIDIFTALPGLDFDEAYGQAEQADVEGLMAHFLGKSDLSADTREPQPLP